MKKAYLEAKSTRELCKLLEVPPSEAAKIVIRRKLLLAIKKRIEKKGWTHHKAARRSGVGRTVITAIVNGNLDRISTDRLIEISEKLGLRVRLEVA